MRLAGNLPDRLGDGHTGSGGRLAPKRTELSAIAARSVKPARTSHPGSLRERRVASAVCKNTAMDESLSLWALFASSFLAATLLPGGSEVVLFAVIKFNPQETWPALAVATVGNTLGGMSSYLIGRLIPQKREIKGIEWVKRYGSTALLLAWVPLIGDPLCVAAGWLRVNPWWCALFMAIGKFARYLVVAGIAL
jgi:membrane protein YqaA with SNARE-associated domain